MGERLTQNYVRPANLYENEEFGLLPRSRSTPVDPGTKGLKCFHVLNIVSPGEFYVVDETSGENWMNEMQKVYNEENTKALELFKIKDARVVKGRCYVWMDKNKWWFRVRVENPDTPGHLALVLLVDLGVRQYTSINDMMELHPRFSGHPTLGGQCAELVDIGQPGNMDDSTWSSTAATEAMKEMCQFRKKFHAVILTKNEDKLGLILAEKLPSGAPHQTVQAKLVHEKGLADCFGLGAGRRDLAHIVTGIPAHNQEKMKRKLTKEERKSFENFQVPIRGRHYSTIYRGPVNRFQSSPRPSILNSVQRQNDRGAMPLKMRLNLAWIVITAFVPGESSASFFIQMRSKCEMLEEMMEDLERTVQGQAALVVDSVKAGSIVAALITDGKEVPYWTRVVIKNVQKTESTVEVILIDYGIELNDVPTANLRKLPQYFHEISPFCQRAHLDVVIKDLSKKGQEMDRWTTHMAKTFRNYISKFIVDDEFYYAWQPRGEQVEALVKLQQFNQDLMYDRTNGQWCPKTTLPGNSSEYSAINAKKDDPLLHQFFTSVGVDIVYEVTKGEDEPYSFLPLWDDLETQFDIEIGPPNLLPVP